jgi:hypothetical protein
LQFERVFHVLHLIPELTSFELFEFVKSVHEIKIVLLFLACEWVSVLLGGTSI